MFEINCVRDIWINGHLTLWSPGYLQMFPCEIETFKPDDTVLLVHRKSVEVHVTTHVEVDSFRESQHPGLVDPEGGRFGVIGWSTQFYGLVNENIRHPETFTTSGGEGNESSSDVRTRQIFLYGLNSRISPI